MDSELLPVVDENGVAVGAATRGECHGGSMLLHPVVHLHLQDPDGRLYLQLRPEWKKIQPGRWDTAVGGHVDLGECVADALRRQLAERGAGNVKNVVFTLSSTKVASREVMLPPLKDNRIQAVVETNASDYFPVDMSSYCIAHTLLERLQGDAPGCHAGGLAPAVE